MHGVQWNTNVTGKSNLKLSLVFETNLILVKGNIQRKSTIFLGGWRGDSENAKFSKLNEEIFCRNLPVADTNLTSYESKTLSFKILE